MVPEIQQANGPERGTTYDILRQAEVSIFWHLVATRAPGSMTIASSETERLVKSTERIRDLGEVFTPSATVNEMLKMLPTSIWSIHPSPTFLEPACGDGNFLVAIFGRKLDGVARAFSREKLPAGDDVEAALFHALEALASIYAVDISFDNIVGGKPGHEIGARSRLLSVLTSWSADVLNRRLTERSPVLRAATWVVEHNLIVGNMLPLDADGNPTGRVRIPLIEYDFHPMTRNVVLKRTTLGDVIDAAKAETSTVPTLFGPAEPEPFWSGKATNLSDAERTRAPKLKGPARNGIGSKR